jgi:hypothetical protein
LSSSSLVTTAEMSSSGLPAPTSAPSRPAILLASGSPQALTAALHPRFAKFDKCLDQRSMAVISSQRSHPTLDHIRDAESGSATPSRHGLETETCAARQRSIPPPPSETCMALTGNKWISMGATVTSKGLQ